MKFRRTQLIACAAAICITACDKKPATPVANEPETSEAAAETAPEIPGEPEVTPPPAVEDDAVKTLTPAQRAEKFGFARYLPQDIEMMGAVYNGSRHVTSVKESEIGKALGLLFDSGLGGQADGQEFPEFDDFEEDLEPADELELEKAADELEEAADDLEEFDSEQAVEAADEEDAPGIVEGTELGEVIDEQEGGAEAGAAIGAALGGPEVDAAEMEFGEEMELDEEIDLDEMMAQESGPSDLFGQEVTFALGKNSGQQTAHLMTMNRRYQYFQIRTLAASLMQSIEEGTPGDAMTNFAMTGSQTAALGLLTDPESGIGLYEKSQMPPLYIGFRTSEERREAASQQLASFVEFFGMSEEVSEAVETNTGGADFSGYRIAGEKVVAMMRANEEEGGFKEMFPEAEYEKFLKATEEKNLVVLSGLVGDYVVLFLGTSVDELKLVESPDESILAGDTLAYLDAYADKDVIAVTHGDQEALSAILKQSGGLGDMAKGFSDGLAEAEGGTDTRDIQAMLQIVADRENALQELSTFSDGDLVAYAEDGVKIENYGGIDYHRYDLATESNFRHLGDDENALIFVNGVANGEYSEKLTAYLEAVVETSYATAMRLSTMEIDPDNVEFQQFKDGFQMFDGKMRSDFVNVWQAVGVTMDNALGNESALVVDFQGQVPPIPGIPQEVIDAGKWPRATVIAPVVDREKLASAWASLDESAANLLATATEMSGKELSMQRPIDSEEDGFTTWSFSFPFFTDSFTPSVTLDDELFALSTSKTQSLELLKKARAGGEKGHGSVARINFTALQKYASETLTVVEENEEVIFSDDQAKLAQFNESKVKIRETIDAFKSVDSLNVRSWEEAGRHRTSVHFKTR